MGLFDPITNVVSDITSGVGEGLSRATGDILGGLGGLLGLEPPKLPGGLSEIPEQGSVDQLARARAVAERIRRRLSIPPGRTAQITNIGGAKGITTPTPTIKRELTGR
jgi:hypothetical protein